MPSSPDESNFCPRRVVDDLKELASLSGDERGAQRVAWTEPWRAACHWLWQKLEDLPVELEIDPAGNQWATLRGESDRELWIGSHIDSVPDGGWLDGALGVVAGVEVLRALAAKGKPPVTVRLIGWTDEEGRFGISLFGSSAVTGRLIPAALSSIMDQNGFRLVDAMQENGFALERVLDARQRQGWASAYLELHIEQGPVLESLGLPLAVVTGACGVERQSLRFTGQAAHAGSTPIPMRRDALAAAARFHLAVRQIALRHQGMGTIGSLHTHPGMPNVVVGECDLSLEFRHLDPLSLQAMLDESHMAAMEIAAEERVAVEWTPVYHLEPELFDHQLGELCAGAIAETGGKVHRMPSGPLHDAVEMSQAGIPTAMLFVQSLGGLSHSKAEDTRLEHLEQAVDAFYRLVQKTMDWIEERG